jgi:hypothetical protein
MLTECADLVRLVGIRLEPRFTVMRAAIAARGGLWAGFVAVLSSTAASVVALVMPSRRRAPMHRGTPAGSSGPSPERPRSNLTWLRPVLAVVGAVGIVVAGVFGLTQVRANLVLELFPSNAPSSSSAGTASTGQPGATLQGQSTQGAILPPTTQGGSLQPSPKASCSTAPNRQASPTPTPTGVTTSPSSSPSVSPSQTPTTTSPSPTATASTSALSVSGTTGIQTVVNVAQACASPAHSTAAG